MIPRPSPARDVEQLLAALGSDTADDRDAAVARLRILGRRALPRIVALVASDAPATARAAALRVLEGVDDPRARAALLSASADPDPVVADAALALAPRTTPRAPDHLDDPSAARTWVAAHQNAPLSELHDFINRMREREAGEDGVALRDGWRIARGAAHAALARRDSTVALYDMRETFATAGQALPLDFLAAASLVGDASCLEPLARAWTAAADDTWWRDHLRDAASAIIRRAHLNGRSAIVKRVRAKYPGFV